MGTFEPDRSPAVVPLRVEQRDRQRHVRVHRRGGHAAAARHAVGGRCACAGWDAGSASGCILETTYFSEFDLVHIGDHAAINLGATIQTHLFEDRVMKADYLRIGNGARSATWRSCSTTRHQAGLEPRPALAADEGGDAARRQPLGRNPLRAHGQCADLGAPHGSGCTRRPAASRAGDGDVAPPSPSEFEPRRGSPRRGCILAQFSNVMRATTRPSQRSVQLPTDDGMSKVSK